MVLGDGDTVVVICRCGKKVSEFKYESKYSTSCDKDIEDSIKFGYMVVGNPVREYEWVLNPCGNCPMSISHVHGKQSIFS